MKHVGYSANSNRMMDEFKELLSWHRLFVNINYMQSDNPYKERAGELVFQRVLNHPEIASNDKWEQSGQCYICH